MQRIFILALLLLIKINIASAQETNWKLSTEKEGIKIYTRSVSGSKVKALRVDCEFKAKLSQMVAVIMDVKAGTEWVYKTKSCSLVKQVSPSELYYYSEVSLPWPAENRDFVAHLTVTQHPETKVVVIDGPAVPGFVPVKDGIVRISNSKGKWTFTPNGQYVKVEYILQVDPGGIIPSWLTNMFASEGPMQSFKLLKKQIQKEEFKDITLAYIKD